MSRTRKRKPPVTGKSASEIMEDDPMINAACAAARFAPEIFQVPRELKPAKHDDEVRSSAADEGSAQQRASKPTNADSVGTLVNVEA